MPRWQPLEGPLTMAFEMSTVTASALAPQLPGLQDKKRGQGIVRFPKTASRSLSSRRSETLHSLFDEAHHIVSRLLDCQSAVEYQTERIEVFVLYAHASFAIHEFIAATVPPDLQSAVAEDSLVQAEHDFVELGLTHLGSDATNEALFSISTLQRVNRLQHGIASTPPPAGKKKDDARLRAQLFAYAMWANMNLSCLSLALDSQRKIVAEVQNEILEGMRSSVAAYSYARQAIELRQTPFVDIPDGLDDEDRELSEFDDDELQIWKQSEPALQQR